MQQKPNFQIAKILFKNYNIHPHLKNIKLCTTFEAFYCTTHEYNYLTICFTMQTSNLTNLPHPLPSPRSSISCQLPSAPGLALLMELGLQRLHGTRQLGLPPLDHRRIPAAARELYQVRHPDRSHPVAVRAHRQERGRGHSVAHSDCL